MTKTNNKYCRKNDWRTSLNWFLNCYFLSVNSCFKVVFWKCMSQSISPPWPLFLAWLLTLSVSSSRLSQQFSLTQRASRKSVDLSHSSTLQTLILDQVCWYLKEALITKKSNIQSLKNDCGELQISSHIPYRLVTQSPYPSSMHLWSLQSLWKTKLSKSMNVTVTMEN